ncbi:cupin domain-containing protein [[Phormidium] sp. ETS-05]|uniref:cupin domain-containing protein n=1 Tax=[Phormidium] sp. ETS-05 TaxID=222819 RepID=UPI0018EF0662|nr:cupin domain-containing protein [[Phormidium] sp. ETS-05]
MNILEYILSPYDLDKFMAENWTQKAIQITSGDTGKFASLFSWEHLNYLLNYTDLDNNDVELILDGKIVTRTQVVRTSDIFQKGKLLNFLQKGATLKFNNIHKRVPEVAELVSQLQYETGCSHLTVNAYCSHPGRQGFISHYDPYEIFILQIEGAKEWKVFPDTLKYPLIDQPSIYLEPPQEPPYLTCILEPGDVLYLPRGHWHYAVAFSQPSVHLSLGINCATGIDFLEWLLSQMRHQEEWRQILPFPTQNNGNNIQAKLATLLEKLADYTTQQDWSSAYISDLLREDSQLENYQLPQQTGFDVFPSGINTRFKVSNWQRYLVVETDDDDCLLKIGHKEVPMKNVPKMAIEKMLRADKFTGKDVTRWLPDQDWDAEIAPMLVILVKERMIFVDSSNPAAAYIRDAEESLETWDD